MARGTASQRAINRVKNDLRGGAVLLPFGVNQKKWFVIPGSEVHRDIAEAVIREIDVVRIVDRRWPDRPAYTIGGKS